MTLDDLERRNSLILHCFTKFYSFAGQLRHSGWRQTYNVRKILSSNSSFLRLVITVHPAALSLCDSWATCLFYRATACNTCLSAKRVNCDKTKETGAHILIPHERSFISFLKFWAKLTLLEWNADFQSIFARSASTVTPSEKSQINTNIALSNEPKMNIVRCP